MLKNRLALVTALALGACSTQSTSKTQDDPSVDAKDDSIIGGFASGGYEAVGTVGVVSEGKYYMLCTATLISEKVVLSAKHCAILDLSMLPPGDEAFEGKPITYLYDMAFATGNANDPTHIYPIADLATSPVNKGGFVGLGNDVSVLYLAEAAKDIKAIPFNTEATLPAELIGKKAIAIGYGSQSNIQDATGQLNGTRKVGQTTVDAYAGNVDEFIFGSKDNWLKYIKDQLIAFYGQAAVEQCWADPKCITSILSWYDEAQLLLGYEFWTAKKAGDSVTCHGDSGGPLLKKISSSAAKAQNDATLTILGVVSGGMGSDSLACDYGTVYATFGEETQTLLKTAMGWTDPCEISAGVTALVAGSCDGTVATRCVPAGAEGPRRLAVTDCAELDQSCGLIDGLAGCIDPTASTPPAPARPAALKPGILQGAVERASTGFARTEASRKLAKFKN